MAERHAELLRLFPLILAEAGEMLETVVAIMQAWVDHADWRERVHSALHTACNRASRYHRHALRRVLAEQWLASDQESARQVAELLIARIRLLDGPPVDAPGNQQVALLIDGTWLADDNESKVTLVAETAELLRSQVDLTVGFLGSCRPIAGAGERLVRETLTSQPPRPRLLMPWLTEPDRFQFVLLLGCDQTIDWPDLTPEWRERIIVDPGANVAMALWDLVASEIDRAAVDSVLNLIDVAISPPLCEELAGRTATDWGKQLMPALRKLGYAKAGQRLPGTLLKALESLTERIDSLPSEPGEPDVLRIVLCGLQWLATSDSAAAAQLLAKWLDDQEHPVRPYVAAAGATMLLRLWLDASLRKSSSEPPEVARAAPLYELGPTLMAQNHHLAINMLLLTSRQWIDHADWADWLRPRGTGRELLLKTIANAPSRYGPRNRLGRILTRHYWDESGTQEGIPRAAVALGLQLRFALALESWATVTGGPPWGLLIVHCAASQAAQRDAVRQLVAEEFRRLTHSGSGSTWAVAVLMPGQACPLAVTGDEVGPDHLVPPTPNDRLATLGPLLFRIPPRRRHFVTIIADAPFCDLADCAEQLGSENTLLLWANPTDAPPGIGNWHTIGNKAHATVRSLIDQWFQKLTTGHSS